MFESRGNILCKIASSTCSQLYLENNSLLVHQLSLCHAVNNQQFYIKKKKRFNHLIYLYGFLCAAYNFIVSNRVKQLIHSRALTSYSCMNMQIHSNSYSDYSAAIIREARNLCDVCSKSSLTVTPVRICT